MKKHKLRKYTESMKELNLQEQKEIEGGRCWKWVLIDGILKKVTQ